MKRYIIQNVDEKLFNAASKARRDADTIAQELGFEPLMFSKIVTADGSILMKVKMALSCLWNGLKMIRTAERGSIILLQYPQFPIKASYFLRVLIPIARRKKKLKFAALIHDLDSLRGLCGKTGIYCDRKVLPLMDVIICHDEVMKRYLIKRGIDGNKLINLQLFDYLTEEENKEHNLSDGIAIAGNLAPDKSGYIDKIKDLPLHLYGNGRENFPDGVVYHGAYSPEELPGIIEGAFGLVWDGNAIDGCQGKTGRYLRFNNPHKLSLYLASGMPVIVWKKAAVAKFVDDNKIGFSVNSLTEIPTVIERMTEAEYSTMLANVACIATKVREGLYLRTALEAVNRKVR